ncbi:primosomal protein N' [Spirochaetota bacterium]|nr:primosomal protein N' [Spirochaetota bacterium]
MADRVYYYKLVTKHALKTPLTYAACSGELLYKRVVVTVRRQKAVAIVIERCREDDEELIALLRKGIQIKTIEYVLDEHALLSAQDVRLCEWMGRYYAAFPSETYGLFVSFADAWLKEKHKNKEHKNQSDPPQAKPPSTAVLDQNHNQLAIVLNDEQTEVYRSICSELDRFNVFLIKGVTGSGKSYVYLKLALELCKRQKSVLILVPEISLVFQMQTLFLKALPIEQIALFHSKLTPKNRETVLATVRMGRARVIIGTRSALFLPQLTVLSLIIVDEEHENAYKNSSAPRYHTRDVAHQVARFRNIPLIFGSATPSLETYYAATKPTHPLSTHLPPTQPLSQVKTTTTQKLAPNNDNKRHVSSTSRLRYYVLKKRYGKVHLPTIYFNQNKILSGRISVFTKKQINQAKPSSANPAVAPSYPPSAETNLTLFSAQVIKKIEHVLAEKGQVIVYINRRGYSATPLCMNCGYYPSCPNCTVSLTYHKAQQKLRCHYCGYNEVFKKSCLKCKLEQFSYPRYGTEQVVGILRELFASTAIERFDSDELTTAKKLEARLKDFSAGTISILVGTQMLAKGHDFPAVRLMVMLYPERTLLLPDFRSYERVYRELVQASGRAGRSKLQGEVFVETTFANDPLFRLVREGRFDDFYQSELIKRQVNFYPPFSKLVRLVLRGEKLPDVKETALKLKQVVLIYFKASIAARKTQIIGPQPCLIERIKRYFRYHLTIKTVDTKAVIPMLHTIKHAHSSKKKVFIEIDIDPIDLF